MEALPTWQQFFTGGVYKNVRIEAVSDTNGGYWQGRFLLTSFNVNAELGNKVQVEISLQSDGQVTWVAS